MLIDTHTHISKEDYEDIDSVIKGALNNKVERIIISGCEKKTIIEGLELIDKYDSVYMTIGFHPDQVDNVKDEDIDWLKDLIVSNKKIVGIGEIGLDYHYTKENRNEQISLFKKQLDLAKELDLPIVVHSRDAVEDTINTLKEYNLNGIIHCFSGSYETAAQYIKLGYVLGIGGVLTFKNSKLQEVVSKIDLSNIVLETDAPYLSPEPFRGQKNETKNVFYVAKKISEIKNISFEKVSKITSENAIRLFDLNISL